MFMAGAKREHPRWLLLEPLATIAVTLILYFPLDRKDLAELTAIFGALLTVANITQTVRLRREFDRVNKIGDLVDLSQQATVEPIRELLRLYVSILEPELVPLKEDAIEECSEVLAKLAQDKVSSEISGSEYYIWLNRMLENSPRNAMIRAVSTMMEAEWITSPAERKFLDANIVAAHHWATIHRIFVTTRARFARPVNQVVIYEHVSGPTRLLAHIVWQDDLEKHDATLLREIGDGFIIFDDRVALIDVSVSPDEARGIVTMSVAQLRALHRLYDRLMLLAHRVPSRWEFDRYNGLGDEVDASPDSV
ncbi:MAG: hypothetical protein WCF33_03990 [Pseudonocardiaceae bacterium]